MKKFLLALLVGISVSHAQVPTINSGTSGITTPTGTTTIHTMGDDGHVHVPLQFGFPYFGKTFTNSVMYDNGVVGFFAPATTTTQQIGCNPVVDGYCAGNQWMSQPFSTVTGPQWNYMIAPLHSDLAPTPNTVYSTTGDATQMTYRWQDLGEYYNPSNLNTFSLQIKPSGFIGVNYEKINLGQSNVSVGLTGDTSKGEYAQHFWAPAGTAITSTSIPNWNVLGTGVDQCVVDPLSSTTCPGYTDAMCLTNSLFSTSCSGYQQAYLTQQCTANPLYSTQCSGYAAAYLSQQCSLDPLYSTTCDGYEKAYHDKQCSADPLYATDCTGYAKAYHEQQCSIDPLYSKDCTGYAAAYFTQQCTLNALYNVDCPGYGKAYFDQQCSLNALYNVNCAGYTQAYHDQQCSINALYAKDCPGYAAAYKTQQCTLNALYATDCPGYAAAYFTQQCNLDGLYDQKCPNYSEAYAKKMLLEQQGLATTVATAGTVAAMAPATTTATVSNDGTVTTTPSTTGSTVVDKALPPPPAVNSAAAPSAPVQLVQQPKMDTTPPPQERKPEGGQAGGQPPPQQSPQGGEKPQPTARQQLAERRMEAAKREAVEKGKNLANDMGKVADMEAQKQIQNVVIAAMGYTPGFDNYGKSIVPDVVGYKPFTVYNNQNNVDNKRLGMGLYGPSDRLHNALVESQFRGN